MWFCLCISSGRLCRCVVSLFGLEVKLLKVIIVCGWWLWIRKLVVCIVCSRCYGVLIRVSVFLLCRLLMVNVLMWMLCCGIRWVFIVLLVLS